MTHYADPFGIDFGASRQSAVGVGGHVSKVRQRMDFDLDFPVSITLGSNPIDRAVKPRFANCQAKSRDSLP